MAPRRNTTPLFEIVSRNGHTPPAAAGPERAEAHVEASRSETRRRPPTDDPDRLVARPLEPRDAESAADEGSELATSYAPAREVDGTRDIPKTMGRISVAGGTVRLPLNYAYIGLSGVLVVALIAWTLGYVFGGQNADEQARREIETAAGGPNLRDPLADGTSADSATNDGMRSSRMPTQPGTGELSVVPRSTQESADGPALSVPAGLPAITDTRTAYLAPGGYFEAEPRTPGLNYFCLVSRLPEADAARALDFLARNGVIAMGLEHERSTANNRLFDLYTLEGLTRPEYARDGGSTRRDSHEALLLELGRRWRAEERGTSDFGQPAWYRFNP